MENTLEVTKPNNKKKKHLSRKASSALFVIFMLLLPVIQFIIFWIVPNFSSIIMGFRNDDGGFTLYNFEKFFTSLFEGPDPVFGKLPEIVYAIVNSLIYFAINIFICTPIVIFFSYVLFRRVPMSGVFKVIFYMPSIIGGIVMTTLFKVMFDNNGGFSDGPLFRLLASWGWLSEDTLTMGLFSNPSTAFLMVLIYSVWTCVGINMIMFYGAMKRIPTEVFESADLDGVGFFKQFIHIVVPLIWPTITTLIIFSLSGIFVSYGAVMILCPKIPQGSMIGWFIIHYTTDSESLSALNYPAAVGLVFTAIGLPFVLLVRKLLNKIGSDVEY